tara:strand:- start:12542 stop:12724 length:183 start_codon:yes stop_codon:yes gene_type:complete
MADVEKQIKKLKIRVRDLEREFIEYEKLANLDRRVENAMQIIADSLGLSLSELFEVRRRR